MADYDRSCVPTGKSITVRVVFTDSCGEPVAVDDGSLAVYVYDPDATSSDIDDAVDASDFSGAFAGDLSGDVTAVATGFYELEWEVPSGSDSGTYTDVWVAEIDGAQVYQVFSIVVVDEGIIRLQSIGDNILIAIVLSDTIADTDGNTLEEETSLSFSTTYNPYYASPELIRLECGGWVDQIPDDTISLMIHWSSIEANAISPSSLSKGALADVALTKFVIYDAALRLLLLPADTGGKSKSLGDLMIKYDSDFSKTIVELQNKREEWFRVVNARGNIVPGQGLDPTFAVKGLNDPDRRRMGRGWWSPKDYPYRQPAANTKLIKLDGKSRKYKKGFASRSRSTISPDGDGE